VVSIFLSTPRVHFFGAGSSSPRGPRSAPTNQTEGAPAPSLSHLVKNRAYFPQFACARSLGARMRQSGHWEGGILDRDTLTRLLRQRFEKIDFRKAAEEVRVFLQDPRELELWSTDFFLDLADRIEAG
jgi:hypothetical protein